MVIVLQLRKMEQGVDSNHLTLLPVRSSVSLRHGPESNRVCSNFWVNEKATPRGLVCQGTTGGMSAGDSTLLGVIVDLPHASA
jgi:hypothetical protein